MRKLLNTLFVSTQGAYLSREGENIVVSVEREEKARFPIHLLQGVVCFGNVLVSPFALGVCAENRVFVTFLTESGRFLARVEGEVSGSVLTRKEQFRRSESGEASGSIAKSVVAAKILNCRTVLQRGARDHPESPGAVDLNRASDELRRELLLLEKEVTVDGIRGREGAAAATYFGTFDNLIVAQKDYFQFRTRSRRPPLDPVNALLSFLYTLLIHDTCAGLAAAGLDPQVGFLHRDRPGRPSLALDLMEELRPLLADRLALSLINRRQVGPKDFVTSESGGVTMTDSLRKEILAAWQKRKQEDITHPFLMEKMPMGLIPYVQGLLLSRFLRGDHDAYPPFIWK